MANLPREAYQNYLENDGLSFDVTSSSFNQLLRYSLLKLGSTSMFYPFELVRLFRQVQCRPDEQRVESELYSSVDPANDKGESAESLVECDEASFYEKLKGEQQRYEKHLKETQSTSPYFTYQDAPNKSATYPTDSAGYLYPSEPLKATAQSSKWPLVVDKKRSIWSSTLQVAGRQGLFSLWHGIFSFWCYDVAFDLSRATVEEVLVSSRFIRSGLGTDFEEYDYRSWVLPAVAEGIVGTLLSPLEIARVRLAVQSLWQSERKYTGTWSVIKSVWKEGGLFGLYPNLALSMVSHFIGPAMRIIPLSILARRFDSHRFTLTNSILYFSLQHLIVSAQLAVTLPLETVRRRLFVQSSVGNSTSTFITAIPVNSVPYTGALDCFMRIVREEGVSSLYQGWGFQLACNTALLLLNLVMDIEDDYSDELEGF